MAETVQTNESLRQRVLAALAKLGVLVAVPGGVALLAVQSNSGETGASLARQFEATVVQCTAALFYAATGVVHPAFAVPRYLMAVLSIVDMLESLNGFGDPDIGSEFREGIETFSGTIPELLHGAAPSNWHSGAAGRYADEIIDIQQNPAETIAAADQLVVQTLANQAYWIRQSRDALAILRTAVGAAIPTAIVWAKIVDANYGFNTEAARTAIAVQLRKLDYYGLLCACFVTVGAVIVVGGLVAEGCFNADDFSQAARKYQQAFHAARPAVLADVAPGC
ncbi:MAG: hypothetical protein K2Q25_01645 [Mycobacteriaceae bacterium]|nr:hypothetical protein [Mycobacteriaceae bacterium]